MQINRLDNVDINLENGHKYALCDIRKGENILEVTLPFGNRTNTEWCYLLGNFGVKVTGRSSKITALPEKLSFGSILNQGLPFYGGNITYKLEAETENNEITVTVSDFMSTLVSVNVDGNEAGNIIYPPYTLKIPVEGAGKHKVDITAYLHRYNTFGPLHLVNVKESWHGPGAWRSEGINWSYEYVLRTTGILKTPGIN